MSEATTEPQAEGQALEDFLAGDQTTINRAIIGELAAVGKFLQTQSKQLNQQVFAMQAVQEATLKSIMEISETLAAGGTVEPITEEVFAGLVDQVIQQVSAAQELAEMTDAATVESTAADLEL